VIPPTSMEDATMIAIIMLIGIGWYSGWRILKEDWSGQSISSTVDINERY